MRTVADSLLQSSLLVCGMHACMHACVSVHGRSFHPSGIVLCRIVLAREVSETAGAQRLYTSIWSITWIGAVYYHGCDLCCGTSHQHFAGHGPMSCGQSHQNDRYKFGSSCSCTAGCIWPLL
jgi:hypothetical protein